MSRKILIPIADGTEEIEAVCIIDILTRAGAEVVVASVNDTMITASRGVKIVASKLISECVNEQFDLIALPGGMPGAEHLRDNGELTAMLKKQANEGRFYAAICASPAVVLLHHGLLDGKAATCHPAFQETLINTTRIHDRVVVDRNCITSQGPGTAIEFALELVRQLYGPDVMKQTADPMIIA